MASSSTPSSSEWLSSITPSHRDIVCEILYERENKRDSARLTSKLPPKELEEAKYTRNLFGFLKLTDNTNSRSHYSVAVAALPENIHYNRYLDVAPYDRTRVTVDHKQAELGEGSEQQNRSDYLNASWVLERFGHKWWIATQAPLPVTAYAFLSIFLQPIPSPPKGLSASRPRLSRLRTIVQLTQNYEGGRRKADAYFPSHVGKSFIVSPDGADSTSALKVTLLRKRSIKEAHCVHSTIAITPITLLHLPVRSHGSDGFDELDEGDHYGEGDEKKTINIQHLLYTAWPDHGVPEPEDRAGLLTFLHLVDSTNRDVSLASQIDNKGPDSDPPIVVGCSAGIGRTGSFIALSSLLRSYGFLPPPVFPTPSSALPRCPLGALPRALKDDLVAQEVDSLREQRPGMVQRDEQILLIYEILEAAFGLGTKYRTLVAGIRAADNN
jgi:protein tyrosine phosphatase